MPAIYTLLKFILVGICIAIIASASYAAVATADAPVTEITKIDSPPPTPTAIITSDIVTKPHFRITNYLVELGDNLSLIFVKLDIPKQDLHEIVHANDVGKQFASISPDKTLQFKFTQAGELQQLRYVKNLSETLIAKRADKHFQVEKISKDIEYRIANAQASIQSSLFLDGKKVGLSDKLIMELTQIFAWEIDFSSNLRVGDQFTVVYENKFIDDQAIGIGDILAVEFINRGHSHKAVRYQDEQGKKHYYTPEGKSLKKPFLSSPIEFARISSHFNLRRTHPVLNQIRAHKGVDYAAKSGTPIKTTGNGRITFRGRKGGYGNTVVIQHGTRYSTLYAHLSKFKRGLRVGSTVTQGTTIGYVGKTGLATGPHLHYEFRVDGRYRNPLKVVMPENPSITQSELAAFKLQTQPLITQLDQAKATLLVAQINL